MRPDPGRDAQESVIAGMPPADRVRIGADLRAKGMLLVWQQVDAAGIDNPVEQADFVLRRLYPEMPEAWFRDVVSKLAAKHVAGEWQGFERPEHG